MKKYLGLVGVLAIAALVYSTAQARPNPVKGGDPATQSDARGIQQANSGTTVVPGNCSAFLETTNFESDAGDGSWANNYQICGPTFDDLDCLAPQTGGCTPPAANENCCGDYPNPINCWFTSSASPSCKQPSIRSINPSPLKGPSTQHMRLQADLSGAGSHQAFTPLQNLSGAFPTYIKFDLYGSAVGGPNLRFRAFDDTGTVGHAFAAYMFFVTSSLGNPYILLDPGPFGPTQFFGGYWTPGEYQQVEILSDPCRIPTISDTGNVLIYKYGGAEIFRYPVTGGPLGDQMPSVERTNWLMTPNSGAAIWDVDNYSITRGGNCPTLCGDGFVDAPETCEPGIAQGQPGSCNPGHTCGAAGTPGACTCSRICTLANPCILDNGDNGPYYGPYDAAYGAIFLYQADTESVSINTCGSLWDTKILYWGSANDPADGGATNDDCETAGQSWTNGSDPSAPCYNNDPNYESCTCHDLPLAGDNLYLAQILTSGNSAPGNDALMIEITKKVDCGNPIAGGACCNGEDGLCTQQATETACLALSDQTTYYPNKTCDIVPECVRHTGACCDNNPKADHCTEGTYPEDCAGANQTWVKGGDCGAVPSICPALTLGACCNTLAGSCTDNSTAADCGDTNPLPYTDQRVFTLDSTCANTTCDADLGACCDTDPFGGCVDSTSADCVGSKLVWTKGGSCATTECVHNAIPTVSTWGLAILTLLLLTGAKIYFGRRQASAA